MSKEDKCIHAWLQSIDKWGIKKTRGHSRRFAEPGA